MNIVFYDIDDTVARYIKEAAGEDDSIGTGRESHVAIRSALGRTEHHGLCPWVNECGADTL